MVWLTVTYGPKGLEVLPVRMQELRAGPGVESRRVDRSRSRSDRRAAERHVRRRPKKGTCSDGGVWQPALLQITRDGVVTNVIEFPKEFQITGDGKTGLRDNQGLRRPGR